MSHNGNNYSEYKYYTTYVDPNFEKGSSSGGGGGGGGGGCFIVAIILLLIVFIPSIILSIGGGNFGVGLLVVVGPIIIVGVIAAIWIFISNRMEKKKDRKAKNAAYESAKALLEAKRYDEAIAAFSALNSYQDSETMVAEAQYQKAQALYDSGKYAQAYYIFKSLKHKDASTLVYSDDNLRRVRLMIEGLSTKGEIVEYGKYDWKVIDVVEYKSLLISQNSVADKAYDEREGWRVDWDDCSLRQWLNSSFLEQAFTPQEQGSIIATKIWTEVYERVLTEDKVFLLSGQEALKYRDYVYPMQIEHTWWLRTRYDPHNRQVNRIEVVEYGITDGQLSNREHTNIYGVRPCIWVDLEKIQ